MSEYQMSRVRLQPYTSMLHHVIKLVAMSCLRQVLACLNIVHKYDFHLNNGA